MKKKVYTAVMALLALALVVGGIVIVQRQLDYRSGAQDYEAAAEAAGLPVQVLEPVKKPAAAPASAEKEETDPYASLLAATDLDALRETNGEVKGWILIPETEVSYPILQAQDNSYYLTHTWSKDSSAVGAIFLECMCSADWSGFNTIVYGHNMRNGSMFGTLRYYRDMEYWQAHPSVYVVDDGNVYRYDVFAAYEAGLRDVVYRLDITQSGLEQDFLDYAGRMSSIDTGIQPGTEDKFLTLSTCTGRGHATRWVVQAVLAETFPKEALS